MPEAQIDKSNYSRLIKKVLSHEFPWRSVSVYRYNPVSWRVRVIDPRFEGLSTAQRVQMVRPLIRTLPEEIQGDITFLLMLSPEEVEGSLANLEFENPGRSNL